MKIGVFLSSKNDIDPAYQAATLAVGEMIGRMGATLVYGGSTQGQMEILAQATKAAGGTIIGVVPDALVERGMVSTYIDTTFRCRDLSDRKAILMRESDVMVALPGGIGTVDETVSLLAMNTFLAQRKPMILLNIKGCWDAFIALLRDLESRNFLKMPVEEMVYIATTADELETTLKKL